jgi:hypothetical protein
MDSIRSPATRRDFIRKVSTSAGAAAVLGGLGMDSLISSPAAAAGMNWQTNDKLPLVPDDRQIIIASLNKESQRYAYNVVYYYAPMELWYGGPGIRVRRDDIEYWAEIPGPKN